MNSVPITISVDELERLANAYPPLDHYTQQALAILTKVGPEEERNRAIEKLFKHNASRFLYFIRLYAKDASQTRHGKLQKPYKYMLRWKHHAPWTMTSDEILSACLTGFWRAVQTFDPARGNFNQHANVLIWQAIMKARRDEERRNNHIAESIDADTPHAAHYAEPASTDDKEIARMIFELHLERNCSREDADRVLRMLDGKEEVDSAFLASVGAHLRSRIPPNELLWLEETLTRRNKTRKS